MTDNLSSSTPYVNPEPDTTGHHPPKEYAKRIAINNRSTIQYHYPDIKGLDEDAQLLLSLQAITAVSYWWATGACACFSCIYRYADNARYLGFACELEVARVYGTPPIKMPHRAT